MRPVPWYISRNEFDLEFLNNILELIETETNGREYGNEFTFHVSLSGSQQR